MSDTSTSSGLLLDELLEAGDERVLQELLGYRVQKRLGAIATKLMGDARPVARGVMKAYIDDGCARPGHRLFVKTLYKAAEKAGDNELMAHFAVAFDRLVQRSLVTTQQWDYAQRRSIPTQRLADPNLVRRLPRWRGPRRTYKNPVTGVTTVVRRPHVPLARPSSRYERTNTARGWRIIKEGGGQELADPLVFTFSTRRYLQRRTWRYFRRFAKVSPQAYRERVLPLLALYRDEHLTTPEALLDSWLLVHALYGRSPVLHRKPLGITLAEGRTLSELDFAPFCPEAWSDAYGSLLDLALTAGARPVRRFALWALAKHHSTQLAQLTARDLLRLLTSPHDEVQAFGASHLKSVQGLGQLPITDWLHLLAIENPDIAALVTEAVRQHVSPSRLSLEQCITLACQPAAPVAELGLTWAMERPLRTQADLEALLALRHARAPTVRTKAVEWLSRLLLLDDHARPIFVRELLDARHGDVRQSALALMQKDPRFGNATELWLAMSETPWPDVRDHFLEEFEAREDRFPPEALNRVWATTLLAIHRGNRAKRQAARQVADRIVRNPAERQELLTLLSHTLRSVRPTEQRVALSQLVRAATHDAGLRELMRERLPELELLGDEVTE